MAGAHGADPGLQRFLEARELLQEWLVAEEELEWRIRHVLPSSDGFRKAAGKLLSQGGISDFQSCADICAERYGAAQGDGNFPCFDSFVDVFYGDAQQVESRARGWSRRLRQARGCSPPRKKRRGEVKAALPRPTLLDRSLLRDVGRTAKGFMQAVRALPNFNVAWEDQTVRGGFALMIVDGDLRAREAVFLRNLAMAERALEERPLCAQDVFDIALTLRRALPDSDTAKKVLCFVGTCPGSDEA